MFQQRSPHSLFWRVVVFTPRRPRLAKLRGVTTNDILERPVGLERAHDCGIAVSAIHPHMLPE